MITRGFLEKKYKQISLVGGGILVIILLILFLYKPNYYKSFDNKEVNLKNTLVTNNTVRINGKDVYETAAAISQITYPATFEDDKPNAVILVRSDKKEDAVAAAGVIHHPINAPILYIEKNSVPKTTLKEIERLDPQGVFVDNNVKLYLIGEIGEGVKKKLKENGWKYRHIKGKDPFTLGKNINDYMAAMHGDHSDVVMVAPIAKPEYGLVQASWNAHMGDGFFYIKEDGVPEKTAEALGERYGDAYIYILGNRKLVGQKVEATLAEFGHVQWIPGNEDVYKQSVGFAGYKDIGKNFGWWINKRPRDFGWGVAEAGHNFIFVNPKDWQIAVSASVLSHKGKHGPMLLVKDNEIPEAIKNYLKTVKPNKTSSQEQLYNHGWIIGGVDSISEEIQEEIDNLLSYEGNDNTD